MDWQLEHDRLSRRRFLTVAALSTAALLARRPRASAADPPASEFVELPCGIVRLASGRRLAYADYGDPAGAHVILHHHGFSSCRLEVRHYRDVLLCRRGIRMIVVDRPGIGQSDHDPCQSFLTWPNDLAQFADALKLKRFAVSGASGGAPYALAAARALPERVTVVSLACPMAPLEVVGTANSAGASGALLAQRHPVAARIALNQSVAALRRNPRRTPGALFTMSPADHAAMADPVVKQLTNDAVFEAFRQGADRLVVAAALLATPWACWLNGVSTKVTILQGCADRITPPAMARYLVSALPNAEAHFYPDEGHSSLQVRYRSRLLDAATTGK